MMPSHSIVLHTEVIVANVNFSSVFLNYIGDVHLVALVTEGNVLQGLILFS